VEFGSLSRSGEAKYLIGTNGNGISQKWVIGRNHWRHAEFIQFSKTIQVTYADEIIDGKKKAAAEWKAVEAEKNANHVVRFAVNDEWKLVV